MLNEDIPNMKRFIESARQFAVDYDPLEYLLIGLIDAKPSTSIKREKRLQTAYEAITGLKRNRVDGPDSEIAKAMFEAIKQQGIDYRNQLKPEYGGPVNHKDVFKERDDHMIANQISENSDNGSGNYLEYIFKRLRSKYNVKAIQQDSNGYYNAVWARYALYVCVGRYFGSKCGLN